MSGYISKRERRRREHAKSLGKMTGPGSLNFPVSNCNLNFFRLSSGLASIDFFHEREMLMTPLEANYHRKKEEEELEKARKK